MIIKMHLNDFLHTADVVSFQSEFLCQVLILSLLLCWENLRGLLRGVGLAPYPQIVLERMWCNMIASRITFTHVCSMLSGCVPALKTSFLGLWLILASFDQQPTSAQEILAWSMHIFINDSSIWLGCRCTVYPIVLIAVNIIKNKEQSVSNIHLGLWTSLNFI